MTGVLYLLKHALIVFYFSNHQISVLAGKTWLGTQNNWSVPTAGANKSGSWSSPRGKYFSVSPLHVTLPFLFEFLVLFFLEVWRAKWRLPYRYHWDESWQHEKRCSPRRTTVPSKIKNSLKVTRRNRGNGSIISNVTTYAIELPTHFWWYDELRRLIKVDSTTDCEQRVWANFNNVSTLVIL